MQTVANCWPKYMAPSSNPKLQHKHIPRKHMKKEILLQIHNKEKKNDWTRCDFRHHSWWHCPLVLEICTKVSIESRACWLLLTFSAMTTFPIVALGQCRAGHSSAHRACSAKPGQTHWFALIKSMGRLIQNLARTIQLARIQPVLVNPPPVQVGLLPLEPLEWGLWLCTDYICAHYRFMGCNTNRITVLSYLTPA